MVFLSHFFFCSFTSGVEHGVFSCWQPKLLGRVPAHATPSLIGKQRQVWAGLVLRWLRQPSRAG